MEGGQRAIIFNRIGGIQMDTVLAEGLHFRFSHILLHVTGLPVYSYCFISAFYKAFIFRYKNKKEINSVSKSAIILYYVYQDTVVPVSNYL